MTIDDLCKRHKDVCVDSYIRWGIIKPEYTPKDDEFIIYHYVCLTCSSEIYKGPFADHYGAIPS
jgi:hypothetical protein